MQQIRLFCKRKGPGADRKEILNRLNADAAKSELLETGAGTCRGEAGLIDDYKKSAWETPGIPKMTFVAEPDAYETADGTTIRKEEIDLLSRMMSMQKSHPSYAR